MPAHIHRKEKSMTATITPERQRRIRQTTAGSAVPVRNIMTEIPQLAGIQLDYYLMQGKINNILYIADPYAMTPETWREKATQLAYQMRDMVDRIEAIAS